MTEPIAVFTADNHLRPRAWARHADLCGDAEYSFRQVVEYCVANRLPLLQLGDLFDSAYPDAGSVAVYMSSVEAMQRAGCDVYYIEGNHDKSATPWASLHRWARLVDSPFRIAGRRFTGFSFTRDVADAETLRNLIGDAEVVLAHQSWKELQGIGSVDGTLADQRSCVVLTGDYHVCCKVTIDGRGGPVTIYSPGSTAMQAINEAPDKYLCVLNDDLSVTTVPLTTRPVLRFVCDTQESLDDCCSVVRDQILAAEASIVAPASIKKPIVHVKYRDSLPDACARISAAVGGHAFLFPQVVAERVSVNVQTPERSYTDLIAAATQIGEAAGKQAAAKDAVTLLRACDSDSVQDAITDVQKQFIGAVNCSAEN